MTISLKHLEGEVQILEKLRDTGTGAIYKVRDRASGELRAVEVVRPVVEGEADLRLRFLPEAHAATRLGHPNVARIFDGSIGDDGAAYVVRELVPGTTVAELLKTAAPVEPGLALEVARQGLAAIGHLHRHGVAYRDLSPDRLMLTHDGDGRPLVKLVDSGLARDAGDDRPRVNDSGFFGTIRYAPPETFDDQAPRDPRRSDLYTFALVLYELLTGRFPIAGESGSALIAGHLFRPPLDFDESDPEGKVPEPVRRAVMKALAKSPDERFVDAERFAAALGASLEPPSLEAAPTQVLAAVEDPSSSAALDQTLRTIRALRDDGRTGEAFRRLNQAVRELGSSPPLKTLRDELGEALLARDDDESASLIAVRPAAATPDETSPLGLSNATIRSVEPSARRARERTAPPTAHPTRNTVAVGLVLAAVFGALVYVLVREGAAGSHEPLETAAVPAADLAPGSLALDAAPWAEIVALDNPAAEDPVPISPSRFTPVVLSLPPGEYRITLRHPPTGRVEERVVRVDSGVRVLERVTFEALDGERYFELLGW